MVVACKEDIISYFLSFFLSLVRQQRLESKLSEVRKSQIRKLLRSISPQIAIPQIFMTNPEIANFYKILKYCTTMSQKVLKVVNFNDIFYFVQCELEHYMLYLQNFICFGFLVVLVLKNVQYLQLFSWCYGGCN